jgi:hypothetical protein
LNPDHEEGKHKARVFWSALRIGRSDAALLKQKLLESATEDAALLAQTKFGNLYIVDFAMTTPHGAAVVRSGWIVREGEDYPRLTSCFVTRKLR